MTEILKPQLGGGGGLLREEFELHRTNQMRIVAVYWVVPSSAPDRKHTNLRIEQYKKKPNDPAFLPTPTNSINLDEGDLDKLIASAKAQTLLKDSSPSDRVVVLRGAGSDELLTLTDRDVISLKLLLTSLTDENIRKLAQTVDAKIVEKIDSAVRYVHMEESLQKLVALVEADTPEGEFQQWFNQNTWVFGKHYVSRIPKRTIGLESKADLIYVSVDGFADLVELKKSVLPSALLLQDPSHKSFYPSSDLSNPFSFATVVGDAFSRMVGSLKQIAKDYNGSVAHGGAKAIPLARAVLNAVAFHRDDVPTLAGLFKTEDDLVKTCAQVIAEAVKSVDVETLMKSL